ncbi:wax ester/triacylglycerol synthase family O-acyltransferase [Moraxella sp. FZLJ2107]|uniref:wax ester/triacylglycerol synthase family O-acyltransferase n=1 Tax=unclassified Moraxella TaxID=2685852 RepID=UPI0020C84DEA|nr:MULTISPECIES: wax ester/triacylglycerol synthase family O-acyltransferase [unclassified Moraxella]UTO06081.1 wax ester/triacylglycerol synthase family O-acyltransferase [Moraxella sp. FZLJ2107]UTO22818.1 wax ester/triacylglycerol synthase family O-acyltransferase [Moraxella sp. FZLJ2109]
MRALSVVDLLFLLFENSKQPMHVSGLCTFEVPVGDEHFVSRLMSEINTEILPNFPFNQVLYRQIFWQVSEDFQLHHHCQYHKLTTGSNDELMTLISRIHERPLERSRPLWSIHIIDHLAPESDGAPKRFALFLKIHHALADGVAAMRLFQRSLAQTAYEKNMLPVWAMKLKKSTAPPPPDQPWAKHISEQIKSLAPACRELLVNFSQKKQQNRHLISSFDAPKSILNQRIGTARHLGIRAFDKARFVTIAKRFNVSTNDALMAVCGHALRTYLLGQNALPEQSLVAFVPVSLRDNDSSVGNRISFTPTLLGTEHDDAIMRLHDIHHSMKLGKERFERLSWSAVINYTALSYGWAGLNLATRAYPTKQAFNLIISNVPGDDMPLFLNGAKLTGIYPASVLFDGQALNISFCNYQNRIDFGITACQTALPNIEILLDLIEDALQVYEKLATDQA